MTRPIVRTYPPADGNESGKYPGPDCKAGIACTSCPRWRCTRCLQIVPWCVGAGSEVHPDWCDECFYAVEGDALPEPTGVRSRKK